MCKTSEEPCAMCNGVLWKEPRTNSYKDCALSKRRLHNNSTSETSSSEHHDLSFRQPVSSSEFPKSKSSFCSCFEGKLDDNDSRETNFQYDHRDQIESSDWSMSRQQRSPQNNGHVWHQLEAPHCLLNKPQKNTQNGTISKCFSMQGDEVSLSMSDSRNSHDLWTYQLFPSIVYKHLLRAISSEKNKDKRTSSSRKYLGADFQPSNWDVVRKLYQQMCMIMSEVQ